MVSFFFFWEHWKCNMINKLINLKSSSFTANARKSQLDPYMFNPLSLFSIDMIIGHVHLYKISVLLNNAIEDCEIYLWQIRKVIKIYRIEGVEKKEKRELELRPLSYFIYLHFSRNSHTIILFLKIFIHLIGGKDLEK